jgi:hypothetical protein
VVAEAATNQMLVAINLPRPPMTPPEVSPRIPIPVGPRPVDTLPTDCDDDKTIDFVVTANSGGGPGGNSITIVPILPNGEFGVAFSIAVGAQPVQVLNPHLNGVDSDGRRRSDLVTVNRADGTVSVLVSLSSMPGDPPRFAPPVSLPVGEQPTSAAAINVDFDPAMPPPPQNDTDLDLVVSALVTEGETTRRVAVVLRNDLFENQLTFAPAQLLGSQQECPTVVLGVDVNTDHRVDVVTLNGSLPDCGRGEMMPIVVRGDGVRSPAACPGDVNHDGSINSQDFFDFLSAFFGLSPSADFNADGSINSQDFFNFLTAFFTGCP